jgi:uncharacterized membrane protein YqgA involved in biofilm formation
MHLSKRDTMATGLVAAAFVLYVLRAAEITSSTADGVRVTGFGVLALGFVASAAAVVPSFQRLLHGNKAYLVGMSILGVIALGAGVHMLVAGSLTSLSVVMVAMLILWFAATIHHARPDRTIRDDQHHHGSAGTVIGR